MEQGIGRGDSGEQETVLCRNDLWFLGDMEGPDLLALS